MTGERTRPGSSQSMSAIRVRADELLPETLTPLVPEPRMDWTAIRRAERWAALSKDAAEARAARRLIRELEAA